MSEEKNFYPEMPPMLEGEDADVYTNRLTGADGKGNRPYNHRRFRQCSIGHHEGCSLSGPGGICECPCHDTTGRKPGGFEGQLTMTEDFDSDRYDDILWFADQMQAEFVMNEGKKDGWDDIDVDFACNRIFQNYKSLGYQLNDDPIQDQPHTDPDTVIKHCADIANFAFMIALKFREEI